MDHECSEFKLKPAVFLSYSRRDVRFSMRLSKALEERGYHTVYDKSSTVHDDLDLRLTAQDEWWVTLKSMISASEVMVFIVTPNSAASAVCDDEIAHARALGKRVVPILRESIEFSTAPERLRSLNVSIDFRNDTLGIFEAAVKELCKELDFDVEWHRMGARFMRQASLWNDQGRPDAQLLSAGAVGEVDAWASRRPINTLQPGPLLLEYLDASRTYQLQQRRNLLSAVGAGYVMPVGSALQAGRHDYAIRLLALGAIRSEDFEFNFTPELWHVGARAILSNRLLSRIRPVVEPDTVDVTRIGGTSISEDGLLIAHFSAEGKLGIWNTQEGRCLWQTDAFSEIAYGVHFSGNSVVYLLLSKGRIFKVDLIGERLELIWSAKDDEHLGPSTYKAGIISIRMRDNSLLLFDVSHGQITRLTGHTDHVTCSDYSTASGFVATGSADKTIRIWSVQGDLISVFSGHADEVNSVSFNPSGQKLLSGSGGYAFTSDRTVRWWDIANSVQGIGSEVEVLAEHDYRVNTVTHSPIDKIAASASNDRSIVLYNTEKSEVITTLQPDIEKVTHLHFSSDGSRLVAGGDLGRIVLIDPRTGRTIARLDRHDHAIHHLAFSGDGTRIVSAALDMSLSVWDARLSDCCFSDEAHSGPVIHEFVPRIRSDRWDRRAALAYRNNTASIVSKATPEAEIIRLVDIERGIEDIGFLEGDGNILSGLSTDFEVGDAQDLVWTSPRAGMKGISIWDVSRSAVFCHPPVILIAAALSNGIGILAGNEKNGILFRESPDDLLEAIMSELPREFHQIVRDVAKTLRAKLHSGCYSKHCE